MSVDTDGNGPTGREAPPTLSLSLLLFLPLFLLLPLPLTLFAAATPVSDRGRYNRRSRGPRRYLPVAAPTDRHGVRL